MTDAAATSAATVQALAWADVPTEQVGAGVTRQVVSGEHQTIIRYRYQPGAVFPEHQHPQEQVTLVVSGQLEFTIANQRRRLVTGDIMVIPGGVPHGARVLGDEPVETLNTLSPRRDDHPSR